MSEMRRVTAICNGTVIDHVPGGQALRVLRMLRITGSQSNPVSLVMNVPSSKHGSKDIIKVEDRELTQDELDRLVSLCADNFGVGDPDPQKSSTSGTGWVDRNGEPVDRKVVVPGVS